MSFAGHHHTEESKRLIAKNRPLRTKRRCINLRKVGGCIHDMRSDADVYDLRWLYWHGWHTKDIAVTFGYLHVNEVYPVAQGKYYAWVPMP